jgi:hypothetical protein
LRGRIAGHARGNPCIEGPLTGYALLALQLLLLTSAFAASLLACLQLAKQKEGVNCKLLMKKRMFRETDETITEPKFINLSYIQAQHDYLQVCPCALHGLWASACCDLWVWCHGAGDTVCNTPHVVVLKPSS